MAKDIIQSLDRALEILCLIGESKEPLTIQSLSKAFEMPRTTLYATINTLEKHGFVSRNKNTKALELGWRPFVLGLDFSKKKLDPIVEVEARKLRQRWNQSVLVGVHATNNTIIFILSESPDKPYMIFPRLGFVGQAHCTAQGKVLLAHMNAADLQWIYEPGVLSSRTPNTITDPERLLAELEKVRMLGYAIDAEESIPGLACIAAPIMNPMGECVAAISVSGPRQELFANLEAIKNDVVSSAQYISGSYRIKVN